MSNFITNNKKSDLKKQLIELISKSEELKFLVGLNVALFNFALVEYAETDKQIFPAEYKSIRGDYLFSSV